MLDQDGRVWLTAVVRHRTILTYRAGSEHHRRGTSIDQAARHCGVRARHGQYRFVDTCFARITCSSPTTRTTLYGRAAIATSSAG
jgi:hypothetical protein